MDRADSQNQTSNTGSLRFFGSPVSRTQGNKQDEAPKSEPRCTELQHMENNGANHDNPQMKESEGYTTKSAGRSSIIGSRHEVEFQVAPEVDSESNAIVTTSKVQPHQKSNPGLTIISPRALRKMRRDTITNDTSLSSSISRRSCRMKKVGAISGYNKSVAVQMPTRATSCNNVTRQIKNTPHRHSKTSTELIGDDVKTIQSSTNHRKNPMRKVKESKLPNYRVISASVVSSADSIISIASRSSTRKQEAQIESDKVIASLPRKPTALEEAENAKARRSKITAIIKLQHQHDAQPNTNDWFEERFAMLQDYKKKQGHCLVPKYYPENRTLSNWVFRTRSLHKEKMSGKKNRLTDKQVTRLKKYGFQFYVKGEKNQLEFEAKRRRPKEDQRWHSYLEMLKTYKRKNGNCLVPKRYSENQPLSTWLFAQRQQKRLLDENQHSKLNNEKVKLLEDIGFVWRAKLSKEWKDKDRHRKQMMLEESWQLQFKKLGVFKQKHGHTRVPKVYKCDPALSNWVFRQRAFHNKVGKEDILNDLDIEREAKLESVST